MDTESKSKNLVFGLALLLSTSDARASLYADESKDKRDTTEFIVRVPTETDAEFEILVQDLGGKIINFREGGAEQPSHRCGSDPRSTLKSKAEL